MTGVTPFSVLVSSAGRRVELLRGFRAALADLGLDGRGAGRRPVVVLERLPQADEGVPRAAVRRPGFVPAVLELCAEHGVDLVVPTIDPELPRVRRGPRPVRRGRHDRGRVVARGRRHRRRQGATHDWLVAHGLPTVRQAARRPTCGRSGGWPFPLVVKPRHGSAGRRGARWSRSPPSSTSRPAATEVVVQTLAPGAEHTVDVPRRPGGRGACAPCPGAGSRCGRARSPRPSPCGPRRSRRWPRVCDALPGAYGALTVQVFVDEARRRRRHRGQRPLRRRLPAGPRGGRRLPRWLLEELTGLPSTAPDRRLAGRPGDAALRRGRLRRRRRTVTAGDRRVRVAHLTTVDSCLWYLLRPQLAGGARRGRRGDRASAPRARGSRSWRPTASATCALRVLDPGVGPGGRPAGRGELWRILRPRAVRRAAHPQPQAGDLRTHRRPARRGARRRQHRPRPVRHRDDPGCARRVVLAARGRRRPVLATPSSCRTPRTSRLLPRWRLHSPRRTRLLGNGVDLAPLRPAGRRRRAGRGPRGARRRRRRSRRRLRRPARRREGLPRAVRGARPPRRRLRRRRHRARTTRTRPTRCPGPRGRRGAAAGVAIPGPRDDVDAAVPRHGRVRPPVAPRGLPTGGDGGGRHGAPDRSPPTSAAAARSSTTASPARSSRSARPDALAAAVRALGDDPNPPAEEAAAEKAAGNANKPAKSLDERRVVERVLAAYR